jgi:hypothetical protein
MTAPARKPLSHAVIGLGLVVGAHLLVVEPAAKRLGAARAEIARREADAATLRAVQASLPLIDAAADRARREVDAVAAASTPARDPGALFASLAAIAASHGVRVEQLDPFEPPQPAAAPGADPAVPAPRDTRLGYTMTLDAAYADLAAFLGAVQRDLGFVRITSVRITPSGEADRVSARVQTVHHAFEVVPGAPAAATPAAPTGGGTQ